MAVLSSRDDRPVQQLSNELVALILEQVDPDLDRSVPVDRRQFLSVESFDFNPPSTRGSIKDIAQFRLACHRFADLGAPLLFTHISCRLSRRGLAKLEQLAAWPHLCTHVRKFTYMIPFFSTEQRLSKELLNTLEAAFGKRNIVRLQTRMEEQQQIVREKHDVRILKRAIAMFSALQHIQLLRVHNDEDNGMMTYLRRDEDTRQIVSREWASACSHGSKTIGAALLAADVPWSRFSSPMLSPQSVESLDWQRPASLSNLAERLTCLTLHFDDGTDLDHRMSNLSELFRTVFMAARNMQVVHIGFPVNRPLNLPLEDLFHNVTWERLVAFGVQGWVLDSQSILRMAIRHRDRLKGLRLRDVLLKDGNTWREVLVGLRESMYRLDWVSLRRIGYLQHFAQQLRGVEVRDDLESESESDLDDFDPVVGPSRVTRGPSQHDADPHIMNVRQMNGTHGDTTDEQSSSTDGSDDELGPEAHEMDFPALDSPVMPTTRIWCSCSQSMTADDLDDDGLVVSNTKRKAWERWVVGKYCIHNPR